MKGYQNEMFDLRAQHRKEKTETQKTVADMEREVDVEYELPDRAPGTYSAGMVCIV